MTSKVVVVTGAASGLGRASAKRFVDEGYSVVAADRDPFDGLLADIGGAPNLECMSVDVTDEDSVETLFASTVAALGRLDALVHFAGISRRKLIPEMSVDDWDEIMDVNFKGTFLCCRSAIPHLQRSGGGSIVTTGSELAFVGAANIGAYSASKAGVVHLTRCMARDHGSDNIRVNCICPGPIWTPMLERSFASSNDPEEARRRAEESTIMGRLGNPEEIANMAYFLTSDQASYITGAAMLVDGGVTARAP